MVPVSLADGSVLEGKLRPSSDTPTHLELYLNFDCGGVVHTHSQYATAFAQARLPVRCMGTTHADHFRGDVPVTRPLTHDEIAGEYERETGRVIVETFRSNNVRSDEIFAVLVATTVRSPGARTRTTPSSRRARWSTWRRWRRRCGRSRPTPCARIQRWSTGTSGASTAPPRTTGRTRNSLAESDHVSGDRTAPATGVIAAGVRWIGRVDTGDPMRPRFSWSGTGFIARFQGRR